MSEGVSYPEELSKEEFHFKRDNYLVRMRGITIAFINISEFEAGEREHRNLMDFLEKVFRREDPTQWKIVVGRK